MVDGLNKLLLGREKVESRWVESKTSLKEEWNAAVGSVDGGLV